MSSLSIELRLEAPIIAVTNEQPRILTIPSDNLDVLPFGLLDPTGDRTLELALRRYVRTQAHMELGYVEQLYTFADRFRDPRELAGGPRLVSVAYLALVRESRTDPKSGAGWRSVYDFFPWEDWRIGRPAVIENGIYPALQRWIEEVAGRARQERLERADIVFGLSGTAWDPDRVLERYELLYELGLVGEAARNPQHRSVPPEARVPGVEMGLDHRRVLATAVGRIRGKIRYRPVVFELLPETFTLLQLQRTVEALSGGRLHKQNFRRLVEQGGLVEGTGTMEHRTGGRPAELFRFRRDVLRERPAPGVGLPGLRRA